MNPVDPTQVAAATGAARELARPAEPAAGEPGFLEMMRGVLERASRDEVEAEKQALALAEGRGDVVDAMVSLSKADLSLRFVVTLRNRAIEAYREIMRLQV